MLSKAGYEVSEAEEFEDESGKVIFCFDIISEVEIKARNYPMHNKKKFYHQWKNTKAFMMAGARILKIRMRKMMNTAMMANFFDDEDVEDDNERLH